MISKKDLIKYQTELSGKSSIEILEWSIKKFKLDEICFASSLGAEDQVLTDQILGLDKDFDIFTLDTGRLHESTYRVIQDVRVRYGKKIEVLFPNKNSVQNLVEDEGPNLFYNSIESRKKCCSVRKIEPLKTKLKTKKIWITGLRKEQSVTRTGQDVISWDTTFGLFKLSPLINWSLKEVWNYIKENKVPYNSLHDNGFPSIGCEPCTRAVEDGEDVRSGRWWWEKPEHKECGLHIENGKIIPRRT